MSLKVRVSYTEQKELFTVMKLLKPIIRSCKAGIGGDGPHKRAYMSCDVANDLLIQGEISGMEGAHMSSDERKKQQDIRIIVELLRKGSSESVRDILAFIRNYL